MFPFKKKSAPSVEPTKQKVEKKIGKGFFSNPFVPHETTREASLEAAFAKAIQRTPKDFKHTSIRAGASDGAIAFDSAIPNKMNAMDEAAFNMGNTVISAGVVDWYSSQSFIGWQMCAILAQNWLIDKVCTIPAVDSIRKGWNITLNDGTELEPEQLDYIREKDEKFKIAENLKEYTRNSRIFGIRIAMFLVDSDDPDYYSKPFNIDGVGKGKYKGIAQIDPYWLAPELDMAASANPINRDFYVPTWWYMSGLRVHKSHLCVCIPYPVADVLKPTYFYGGIPLTQKIYERVYAAERCANEAPELLLTKRANVLHVDIDAAMAKQGVIEAKLAKWVAWRNNFGIKILGQDEQFEQQDTNVSDLESVIMTQYTLVASIAGVPVTKLMGTSPSGMNASGSYELTVYREELESLQRDTLSPLLKRHYELLVKSDIGHKFGDLAGVHLIPEWNEIDSLTEMERADVNLRKATTDQVLMGIGAIDGKMAHDRLVADPKSGFTGQNDDFELQIGQPEFEPDPEQMAAAGGGGTPKGAPTPNVKPKLS